VVVCMIVVYACLVTPSCPACWSCFLGVTLQESYPDDFSRG